MKMTFCTHLSIKACYKLIVWALSSIPKVPKIASLQSLYNLKKEVKDEVDFLHADKHQSFLKVCFNTLGIKVFYKVDITITNGHDQAFPNYSK